MLDIYFGQFLLGDLPALGLRLLLQLLFVQKGLSGGKVGCIPGVAASFTIHKDSICGVFSFDQDTVNNIAILIHFIPVLTDIVILIHHVLQEPLVLLVRQTNHRIEFTVLQIQLWFLPVKYRFDFQLHFLH